MDRWQDCIQGTSSWFCSVFKAFCGFPAEMWAGSVPVDKQVGVIQSKGKLWQPSEENAKPQFVQKKILSEEAVLMTLEESRRSRPLAAFLLFSCQSCGA